MKVLTRNQAIAIFKARVLMLKYKKNFSSSHVSLLCDRCDDIALEDQEHILSHCSGLHMNDNTKVYIQDIFSDDTNTLREAANKIIELEKRL